MSKLEELLEDYCPDGVEYKKIRDCYQRLRGTPITAAKMKEIQNADGDIKIFAGGKTVINAFEKDIPKANVIRVPSVLVQSRGIIDAVYYDQPFTFKNEMWAYTSDNPLEVKFLYYVLKNNVEYFRSAASGMGSLPQISLKVTEEFEVPVPPLPVQEEIVRILDMFTGLTAELNDNLTSELNARKEQYNYYLNAMFLKVENDKTIKWHPILEFFPYIRNGFVGVIKPFFTDEEHGVRYLEGTNIHDGKISDNEILYVTKEFHQKHIKNELKRTDLLMVQSGHIGECAVVGPKYEGANCHALIIMSNNGLCDSQYVCYYFHSETGFKKLRPAMTGGTVKHVLAKKVGKISIPFPSIEEQKMIVTNLDKLSDSCNQVSENLTKEIEAREKQYEYYRDKLLTFKRKA